MDEILIELGPNQKATASLTGSVANSEGTMVGAMVLAINLDDPKNRSRNNLRVFTENGEFSFEQLVPGKYVLFAVPESGYMPTFYHENGIQTNMWQEATTLTLEDNSNLTGINFVLTELPLFTEHLPTNIFGVVRDEEELPLSDALISVYNPQNELVNYSVTDESGEFNVGGLEPGSYKVTCSAYGLLYEEKSEIEVNIDGNDPGLTFTVDEVVSVENNNTPVEFNLAQNYPNPFNPTTTISFTIKEQTSAELKVYDILGAEIKTIINDQFNPGNYQVNFDATDLPSGIYIYQLKTNRFIQSRKMLLMK